MTSTEIEIEIERERDRNMEVKLCEIFPFDNSSTEGAFVLCTDDSLSGKFSFHAMLVKYAQLRECVIHVVCLNDTRQSLEAMLRKHVC